MWFADHSPGRGGIILAKTPDGSQPGGKFYVEFQITASDVAGGSAEYGVVCGICSSSFILHVPPAIDGFDNTSTIVSMANGAFYNFSNVTGAWGYPAKPSAAVASWSVGDWLGLAVDTIRGWSWSRNATAAPSTWFGTSTGGGTPSPVTGVQPNDFGAASVSSPIAGNIYLVGGVSQPGNSNVHKGILTLNAGSSAFVATLPTGYVAWDATTVWSATDKAAEISLSGGSLILSNTAQITGNNQPYAMGRATIFKARV
jgi:hypothetical protein